MIKGISINHSTIVHLTTGDVKKVVQEFFEQIKAGRWVREGKVYEEHYTSHCFDAEVGSIEELKHKDLKAVLEFETVMIELGYLNDQRR